MSESAPRLSLRLARSVGPRRPARTVLFVTLAVLLGLLAVELGLRLLEVALPPGPVQARSGVAFQLLPEEPLLRPVPGFPEWLQPASGLIDDASLAIPPRDADELRILVLGGSAVGGWSVARSATFSAVMGRALDEVHDGPVRVFNFGRTGYASAQLAYTLEQTAEAIQPDIVLVVMGNNERQDLAMEAEQLGSAGKAIARRELFRRSATARRLRPPRTVHGDPDGRPRFGEAHPPHHPPQPERIAAYALERYRRSLSRMDSAATRVGARLIVGTVATNHRYRPTRHEWSFLLGEAWARPEMREAYFAWRFGAPDRGLAALEGQSDRSSALIRGVLFTQAGRLEQASAALDVALADTLSIPRSAEPAKAWLWGTRLRSGPEEARAALRSVGDRLVDPEPSAEHACDRADLLWYAGDTAAAAVAYDRCRLLAGPYRAGDALNDLIRGEAERLGAPLIDLDAIVRAHSAHGLPDYDLFVDYCHYTAAGNRFVGYALAAGVASALQLPTPSSSPAQAEADFRAAWVHRTADHLEFSQWLGVSADVPALAALRYGEGRIEHDVGELGSAQALAFGGNRLRDRASLSDLPWFEAAASSWCRALALAPPAMVPALTENLEELLGGDVGNHLRDAAGPDAIEACIAGRDLWHRDALPSEADI